MMTMTRTEESTAVATSVTPTLLLAFELGERTWKLGFTTGLCATLSGNDTTGETMCTQTFLLDGGEITVQVLGDTAAAFLRGETVPMAIVGHWNL